MENREVDEICTPEIKALSKAIADDFGVALDRIFEKYKANPTTFFRDVCSKLSQGDR